MAEILDFNKRPKCDMCNKEADMMLRFYKRILGKDEVIYVSACKEHYLGIIKKYGKKAWSEKGYRDKSIVLQMFFLQNNPFLARVDL